MQKKEILLLFSADKKKVVADVLGNLRLKIGRQLGLIDESKFKFAWVVDFPLLGYDEEAKRYVAEHHPFTRPNEEDIHFLIQIQVKFVHKLTILCLNGYEVGGGSMRIYKRDVQEKMFAALVSPKKKQMKNSASCWKHLNMERLRMAVLLLDLTGWLC